MAEHLAIDGRVHAAILRTVVERGFAPGVDELAAGLGVDAGAIAASLARLVDNHAVVLQPGRLEPWIVHPFALSPTTVWVEGRDRGWWAPCMWCALGIGALVGDARIHARLGGEREAVTFTVRDGEVDGDGVVHFLRPPRDAWDNVVDWCANVQPFGSSADVDAWCARHGRRRGSVHPVAQVADLARRWYGRHLDPDWKKWTTAEAQEIFGAAGLAGEFWAVDTTSGRF